MNIEGWKYYNHAVIPTVPPHEKPDTKPIENGDVWKIDRRILLARWTSEFDCEHETEWWYVIKDTPLDINALKSKRRYEINKGKKHFAIRTIEPKEYVEELLKITIAAYEGWPEKYRPIVDPEEFRKQINSWDDYIVFGAFGKEDEQLCGYAQLIDYGSYVEFCTLRTVPDAEKFAVNAAVVCGILDFFGTRFGDGFYINDGQRAILHETAFQDYLVKYFGFRKAFCRLNIQYRGVWGTLVKILYVYRRFINPDSKIGSRIFGILKMEEIRRKF